MGAFRSGSSSAALWVTWVGLVINLALGLAKVAAGLLGGSRAVLADGIHSFSDLGTDIAVLIGMSFWSQPADDHHPHGHRRIETLVTAGIGLSLAAVAVGMGWDALRHLGARPAAAPGKIAWIAAAVSVVAKEALYRWTAAVGRRERSPAVVANAWHHRSDAFSSIPALIAVLITGLDPSLYWVDRVGALVVCGFILVAAWGIVRPALAQLADAGAPPEDCARIEALAVEVEGVRSAHALRTRYVGEHLAVDLHVEVDGGLTVAEGHLIARSVRQRLVEHGPDVTDVVVQIEPHATS